MFGKTIREKLSEAFHQGGGGSPAPLKERELILRDALVASAMADVGVVMETGGNNRGPRIDEINKFTNAGLGAPYCLSGQVFNAHKVCGKLAITCPIPKDCSTQEFWNRASTQKYRRPKGEFGRKGDWASFQHVSNSDNGHETMLRADQSNAIGFQTVEYNTNQAGSRDGQGTFTHVRETGIDGDLRFQGFINVVQWILDANPEWRGS